MQCDSGLSEAVCFGQPSLGGKPLRGLVQEYIDYCRPVARRELDFFARQPFARAIEHAALCLDSSGGRSSHQWRRSQATLQEARDVLLRQSRQLMGCGSFSELHALIGRLVAHIPYLGSLYSYDAAVHIGANLGLAPDAVYLHCGTREGARALGLAFRQPTLQKSSLPAALRKLAIHEVEDFLCIFRSRLNSSSQD
jgi:hypothetical protein